ncbi:MAG: LysM peptidoglycan-binding domain-containing protein [Treponema sp.]|nr:LysM peptidoglycan-binding domain-containing protein [Treponema sp.]
MKKISILLIVAAVFGMASCKSAPASQEAVNKAFETVYVNYADLALAEGATKYEVKSGDTLTAIAKANFGDGNGYYFPLIMLASSDVVQDPDLIAPGMELLIPDFDKAMKNDSIKPRLKSFFKEISDVYKKKTTPGADATRQQLLNISKSL